VFHPVYILLIKNFSRFQYRLYIFSQYIPPVYPLLIHFLSITFPTSQSLPPRRW